MGFSKYEFQSDFAKHYIALGREEGRTTGLIGQQNVTGRFGQHTEAAASFFLIP